MLYVCRTARHELWRMPEVQSMRADATKCSRRVENGRCSEVVRVHAWDRWGGHEVLCPFGARHTARRRLRRAVCGGVGREPAGDESRVRWSSAADTVSAAPASPSGTCEVGRGLGCGHAPEAMEETRGCPLALLRYCTVRRLFVLFYSTPRLTPWLP